MKKKNQFEQIAESINNPKGIEMAREALGLPPQRWWDDLVVEVGEEKARALWDKYKDVDAIDDYLEDK
jgi:hypothetical protein